MLPSGDHARPGRIDIYIWQQRADQDENDELTQSDVAALLRHYGLAEADGAEGGA